MLAIDGLCGGIHPPIDPDRADRDERRGFASPLSSLLSPLSSLLSPLSSLLSSFLSLLFILLSPLLLPFSSSPVLPLTSPPHHDCDLVDADIDRVVALYDDFVRMTQEADQLRAERNENAAAMKGKLEKEQRETLIAAGRELKDRLASLEAELSACDSDLQIWGKKIPNLTHPDVPTGSEENAAEVEVVGIKRDFTFPVKVNSTAMKKNKLHIHNSKKKNQ
jgi:hypothetical protein